jgi:hypothetical protein
MGLRGLRSYVVICDEMETDMSWRIVYEHGHPEGWTDDLGIMADRNQWVREHLPGWYARQWIGGRQWISVYDDSDLRAWCEENLSGYWEIPRDGYVYMSSEEDVMLFKLNWM